MNRLAKASERLAIWGVAPELLPYPPSKPKPAPDSPAEPNGRATQ